MSSPKVGAIPENAKSPTLFPQLVVLTIEQLTALLDQVVESHLTTLSAHFSQRPLSGEETHFNYTQAVAYLKVSKPTFGKLRKLGLIKGVRVSEGRVLFSKSGLDAYLAGCGE